MAKNYVSKNKKRLDANAPYKSGLEKRLALGACKDLPYESLKVPYVRKGVYNPDFIWEEKNILFEAKGRFRDQKEYSKYPWVRESNPDWEIVFIFQDPNLKMPNAKPSKDGTYFTHAGWATKHNFRWTSIENAQDWINNEKNGTNKTTETPTRAPAKVRKSRSCRTRSKSKPK